MQPPSNKGGYSKYVHQQRYASYSPSASEYQIAVISDMDTKSKVSENELKWRGVLKTATLRREGKKYSVEWTGEVRDSGLGSTTYRISYVSISFWTLCGMGDPWGVIFPTLRPFDFPALALFCSADPYLLIAETT
jgi:hypothetical protein